MSEQFVEFFSGNGGKAVWTLVVLIGVGIVRRVAFRSWSRTADEEAAFRTRKAITYTLASVALVAVAWIWFDAIDSLATYLGLATAGVAIGLSDLLKNIVGWFYILIRRPFKIGDRIEILGQRGDVVDVRLFRFSMLEVGGLFVDAEQSTGRLLHVPNGLVFTATIANYTEAFPFVWHEIRLLVTFESDWRAGRQLMEEAIETAAAPLQTQGEASIRVAAREHNIKIGTTTPVVYMEVQDSGVLLTGRFLINPRLRRTETEAVWVKIIDGVNTNPTIALAYPTSRTIVDLTSPDA
jgi:small-conductance mechanosensitive channel